MPDKQRLRRAGEDAVRLLVDLLPAELDPRGGQEYTTVVFADIEGFSTHVAQGGDDAAVRVIAALDATVASCLADRRVRVVKRLGDGLMAAGRRPEEALAAAVEMVSGFAEAMADQELDLRLRAGVHRGTVRRQGLDYVGYHVNVAARVTEAASGGQVLASANALGGVDLDGLGLHAAPAGVLQAKGVNGSVELFEVAATPIERSGFLSQLRRSLRG